MTNAQTAFMKQLEDIKESFWQNFDKFSAEGNRKGAKIAANEGRALQTSIDLLKEYIKAGEPTEEEEIERAEELARVFYIKKNKETQRFDSTHGDKNPLGLYRTVRGILAGTIKG